MADPFKPTKQFKAQPSNKSKGILDDHAIRKSVATREGSITKTPTADIDIVNKKYVDDTTGLYLPLTGGTLSGTLFLDAPVTGLDVLRSANININLEVGQDLDVVRNITVGGTVGIGTATPEEAINLFTNNSADVFFQVGTVGDGFVSKHGSNTINFNRAGKSFIDQLNDSGQLVFRVGSTFTEAIVIDENADVGIGTSLPDFKLHVNNGAGEVAIAIGEVGAGASTLQLTHVPEVLSQIRSIDSGTEFIDLHLDTQNLIFNTGVGSITQHMKIDSVGNIDMLKSRMTSIGGFAIKLTNKTGANSVAGQLVRADTTTNDAVKLTAVDEEETIGVFLEGGVSDGSEAWVVVNGIADVAMEDNTTATRGNWVRSSATVGEEGYADATNATPPSPAAFSHFNEIGNCIETVNATGGGTHVLARCVLHFN